MILTTLFAAGCSNHQETDSTGDDTIKDSTNVYFIPNTSLSEVANAPAFGNSGRLLFPVNTGYYSGTRLNNLSLTWYGKLDTAETVEIVNTLKTRSEAGDKVFFDIYSDEEKAAEPDKADTGLFFFRGNPGAETAICNAGGGFVFVGAMQDSFPHALELSKMGYNAFALIYRPGWETAMEDLGRALSFLYDHAAELDINMESYSLWGGSAGARMAATLGNSDALAYYTGRKDLPQASAVIMQYTGHSDTFKKDAPTYACVGTSDGIANWRTMKNRLNYTSRTGNRKIGYSFYQVVFPFPFSFVQADTMSSFRLSYNAESLFLFILVLT